MKTTKAGTIHILAKAQFDNGQDKLQIAILPPDPEAIQIAPPPAFILVNGSHLFTATVSPQGASQEVTWSIVGGSTGATIGEGTGELVVTQQGTVTVKAVSKELSSFFSKKSFPKGLKMVVWSK